MLINSSRRQICSLFFQKPLHPQLGAGSGPRMAGQAQVQLFEGSLIPAPQPAAQPAVSNLCQHSCLHCVFQAFNYFHLFQELSMCSCVSGPWSWGVTASSLVNLSRCIIWWSAFCDLEAAVGPSAAINQYWLSQFFLGLRKVCCKEGLRGFSAAEAWSLGEIKVKVINAAGMNINSGLVMIWPLKGVCSLSRNVLH